MRTPKFMGVVAAGLFALTLGAQQAGALTTTPDRMPKGITQLGGNSNTTNQSATSTATTKQLNLNLPISLFTVGSNDGSVHQSNGASTSAKSSNDNATRQTLDQNQKVSDDTHGSKSGPKPGPKPCDKQGENPGYGNNRGDKPGKDGSPAENVSQRGANDNHTSQDAQSKATTKQANVNLPISAFTVGSNDGRVSQSNWADTKAKSSNDNWTDQSLRQQQDVKGDRGEGPKGPKGPEGPQGPAEFQGPQGPQGPQGHGADVSQSGSNQNSTDQDASSTATTKQVNVNAPISLFSVGSNNGDVHQSNGADTKASSSNDNWTDQSAHQSQSVKGEKGSNGDVSQAGKNHNSTDQDASSKATSKQANVNLPISLFSVGSNDGGVHQGNSAGTYAGSSNSNGTSQFLGQGQGVGSVLGW